MAREILFVAYGGGHMRMLVPVAQRMADRGHAVRLLPLTVGVADARSSGLPMITLAEAMADHPERDAVMALGAEVAPLSGHPAVSDVDTHLYHGIGLADLIAAHGDAAGRALFAQAGRKAFAPVRTWTWLLQRLAPRALVSTTAPRSELAALRAAGDMGVPSVCVTDHFLVYEMDYVARPGHGGRICVLGEAVAARLAAEGRPRDEIRVTGNPAFDELYHPDHAAAAKAWRAARGWQDRHIILWPQESGTVQVRGKPLFDNPPIQAALDEVLADDPSAVLVIRPHPNRPDPPVGDSGRVLVDGVAPVAVQVRAADVVVGQATTVCLQAALCGTDVVTVGNGDMPPFARYGLARDVALPGMVPAALQVRGAPDPARLGAPLDGASAVRVADVIAEVL